MNIKFVTLLVAAASISVPALAQTAAPTKPSLVSRILPAKPAKPVAPHAATVTNKVNNGQGPRTAKSLACSKQADAKNIHGKARKAFMESCKKA